VIYFAIGLNAKAKDLCIKLNNIQLNLSLYNTKKPRKYEVFFHSNFNISFYCIGVTVTRIISFKLG
jgi:hypothetical protein